MRESAVKRFILDVAVPYEGDDCLTWPFSRMGKGYGSAKWEGRRYVAHRLVLILKEGQPPTPSHQAAHSCGNGFLGCVNPNHLRWATPLENAADKTAHGRDCPGEKNGNSRLKSEDVLAIFIAQGSQQSIAERFGISQFHVSRIKRGKKWRHLTLPLSPDPSKPQTTLL